MEIALVIIFVCLGVFTQSVTGFGLTLVSMPLLATFFELPVISPLIAVVGILVKVLMLIHYHESFQFRAVWKITLASVLFVPLGVYALDLVSKRFALIVLGLIVLAYAIASLSNSNFPRMIHERWAFLLGAIAGVLGGAYNASGPPVVLYANARRWTPKEFKSNLQGYALINGLVIVGSHAVAGNYSPEILKSFLVMSPFVALTVWLGIKMDRFINPERFRKIILWVLIILGVKLLIG